MGLGFYLYFTWGQAHMPFSKCPPLETQLRDVVSILTCVIVYLRHRVVVALRIAWFSESGFLSCLSLAIC